MRCEKLYKSCMTEFLLICSNDFSYSQNEQPTYVSVSSYYYRYVCSNSSYTFCLNLNLETMIAERTAVRTRLLINHHAKNRMINQKRLNL